MHLIAKVKSDYPTSPRGEKGLRRLHGFHFLSAHMCHHLFLFHSGSIGLLFLSASALCQCQCVLLLFCGKCNICSEPPPPPPGADIRRVRFYHAPLHQPLATVIFQEGDGGALTRKSLTASVGVTSTCHLSTHPRAGSSLCGSGAHTYTFCLSFRNLKAAAAAIPGRRSSDKKPAQRKSSGKGGAGGAAAPRNLSSSSSSAAAPRESTSGGATGPAVAGGGADGNAQDVEQRVADVFVAFASSVAKVSILLLLRTNMRR